MKMKTFFRICTILLLTGNAVLAQVGIGTSAPKGILDVNSSIYGIVYPSVALTATNVAAPVVNPIGGGLAVGTTVYNTNNTGTGANDVQPGIYSWDGSKWVIHFFKRQSELFTQTSVLRSSALLGFENVPGLGSLLVPKQFTAKYSGLYKIEIKMNYGGGKAVNNGDMNTVMAKGDFRFTFNGTPHLLNVSSFSTYNQHISGGRQFENIWVETYKTIYINLTQGQTYNFSLEFDQYSDPVLQASGNLVGVLDGRGYVGQDIPCFIEFTYLSE
jgi:hypothetical protein